jgi:hypothetical protein
MQEEKCWECGGRIVKRKKDFSLYGINIGEFDAEVCKKCGEVVFSEEASDQIDKAAKEAGLWGLEAKTKVAKTGDSLTIRVNKRLAEFLGLKEGKEVTLHPENKEKLVVAVG